MGAAGRGYNVGKETLSMGQVAVYCRCCQRTVRKWCNGELIAYHLLPGGSGHRRIKRLDLIAFMRAHRMPEEWVQEVERR